MNTQETVTIKGNPFKLTGNVVNVGDKAPDSTLVTKRLSEFAGKIRILSSVPSLDTSVCDAETRRFNELASDLGDEVEIITISMDLPPAQKRWCGAAGVDRITLLSDHKDASFGNNYGVLIPDIRLLARCVFVVDKDGVVRYKQLVPEVGQEPDYEAVLSAVKALL